MDLAKRNEDSAIYMAADGPEAAVPGSWERLWLRAEETAVRAGRALVLLDEAHVLPEWAGRLKSEWDRLRRRKRPVHVVATVPLRSAWELAHAKASPDGLSGSRSRIGPSRRWSRSSTFLLVKLPSCS